MIFDEDKINFMIWAFFTFVAFNYLLFLARGFSITVVA